MQDMCSSLSCIPSQHPFHTVRSIRPVLINTFEAALKRNRALHAFLEIPPNLSYAFATTYKDV